MAAVLARPARLAPSILLLAALLLLAPAAGLAEEDSAAPALRLDRVHLKNGNVFEGRIASESADALTLTLPSASGGAGRMVIPREMIARIERADDRRPVDAGGGPVRDAWYLLGSQTRAIGTRHLRLLGTTDGGARGWVLEEEVLLFSRGPHVPPVRTTRSETVDLRFLPLRLHYREVGEASVEPGGPRRYEKVATGPVRDGIWQAMRDLGGGPERLSVTLPPGTRGRLGVREHLLRQRTVGIQGVTFLDPAVAQLVTARAGYTALDVRDEAGAPYDEFVWEEDDQRLVSRFRDAEPLRETLAEGVVAVPATRAQVEAAEEEARAARRTGDADRVTLAQAGVEFRLPGASWALSRVESAPTASGWRKIAVVESSYHVADVRIEWDPEGAFAAPGQAEAEAQLLQRLRSVCPDLVVTEPRASLPTLEGAWRIGLRGTLRGETVHTIAVVVDRQSARLLFLAACPDASWGDARRPLEALLASIKLL